MEAEEEIRQTKVLCHSGTLAPLCIYHPSLSAYACYYSDEDPPPAPETLEIAARRGLVEDLADFEWVPIVQVVGNPDQDVTIYGEYDENGQVV